MITWEEASENPELMIKHKDDLKEVKIFRYPWRDVFHKHPYLYRKFSDRFDEMHGWAIAYALRRDPTLVLDLKNHLHKIHKLNVSWALQRRPELSLCLKYRGDPDKVEAAYYVGYPRKLDDLNNEEKREILKRTIELLKKHLLVQSSN